MKALVTGGTSGIGLAIAESFRAQGMEVFAPSRRNGYDLIREHDRVRAWFACNEETDILVNNCGGGGRWGPAESEMAQPLVWHEVWQKNAQCAAEFTGWALQGMMERGWGRVVTISSIHGREAGGRPWFAAAKAAQIAMMKSYARNPRFVRRGVTFNTVCPGFVLVDGKPGHPQPDSLPMGRPGLPVEVADLVAYICSPKAAYLNGACLVLDGGESLAF